MITVIAEERRASRPGEENDENGTNGWHAQQWWINFLDHLDEVQGEFYNDSTVKWDKVMEHELAKWNAVCRITENHEFIDFENERDVTMFMMRWT